MIEKKELENRIDQIVSPVMNTQTPGMVLLAARGKDILLHKAYGMADLQRGIPITTKSQFAIASNTKQFTCFALMMLKDRGLLHYDDAIADFFPDFPAYRHRVTIRHLMNHCSGIPEYIESPSWLAWEKAACADTAELLDFISALDDLKFEPGSRFSYCNSGYVMLGNIIEQLTYMPFGKFLEKEIFLPAGMHCACAPDSAAERGDALTEGYEINHGKSIRQPYDMALIGYADGNIQATACDMLAWHRFLYEKKVPLLSRRKPWPKPFPRRKKRIRKIGHMVLDLSKVAAAHAERSGTAAEPWDLPPVVLVTSKKICQSLCFPICMDFRRMNCTARSLPKYLQL